MDKLKLTNTVIEVIEDEEDLTPQRLAAMDIIHNSISFILIILSLRYGLSVSRNFFYYRTR